MTQKVTHQGQVPVSASGQRLDQVAAGLFPEFSRARLQEWIKSGQLTINGNSVKPNMKVIGGEALALIATYRDDHDWQPQQMALEITYEDDTILVVNKPADLVVHPAAGNYDGTLLNGLLHYAPVLQNVPRAGIVHRLDKDTTGLMVVAKTLEAQTHLVSQLQQRTVSREYVAVAVGRCPAGGDVNAPVGRDPTNRVKMAVVKSNGKEALTHFKVIRRMGDFSLVRLKLDTGRTHQIRVHMAHLGYPLLGDPLYGKRIPKQLQVSAQTREMVEAFGRQALHAERLSLIHPATQAPHSWRAEWPDDLRQLVERLSDEAAV